MSTAEAFGDVRAEPRWRTTSRTTVYAAPQDWNHADRGTLVPGWVHPFGAQYDGVTTWPGKNGRNF